MNAIMAGVIGYILLQFLIGALVSRRISTESDYINAGRRLGPVIGAFTVFATWFGAEVIVGTSGSVYEQGLRGAEFDPFGYAVSLFIAGFVFAAALWRRGLTTFADFFRDRFGTATERLVVVLLVPGSLFWAAAQIRAFGQVVGAVSDTDVTIAITFAAVVVCAYTVLGGLMADAITDLVQGVAVIIGLIVLAYLAAGELGGFSKSISALPPERFDLSVGGAEASWGERLEHWLVPICGTVVAIELVSRILGCRSAEVAARATMAGAGLYLAVGLIPVYLGLIGPSVLPGVGADDLERVVPLMAERLMPGILYIVFAGAIISAILSTVDSTLIAAASLLSHNVVMELMGNPGERTRLLSVRVSVIAMTLLAYTLAMTATSIRDLVEVAAAFGSSGVVVCLVFGLFTRFGGQASALAALVTGAGVWGIASLTEATRTPYGFALLAAVAAYTLAALWRPAAAAPVPAGSSQ
ncbi:MAG: sodium:solute symporter family protein [Hyphomicrobiaceae bacterium]|nr:sodium:solute symporter family protein [Hyphomicrobiaceae bacterium]MCC0007253.1 sodium:solute symporter family protein [Hyphomicrobiaceae bacterium]